MLDRKELIELREEVVLDSLSRCTGDTKGGVIKQY